MRKFVRRMIRKYFFLFEDFLHRRFGLASSLIFRDFVSFEHELESGLEKETDLNI